MEERLSTVGATKVGSTGRNGARANCVLSMATATFVAATRWLDSGVFVISVTGDLDLATASVFENELVGLPTDAGGTVIVDLACCSFIDLRGLRVLLATRERLERTNRRLALVAGNPDLLRVFKVTRVADLFEIYPSLAAATGGVTSRG